MNVKWNKSTEGFTQSKCGRFRIQPLYMGTTRAQAYELYDERTHGRCMNDTQRQCKDEAEGILEREGRAARAAPGTFVCNNFLATSRDPKRCHICLQPKERHAK